MRNHEKVNEQPNERMNSIGLFCLIYAIYVIAICSRPEAVSDVMSSSCSRTIVFDKCVKFHDPCSNGSREIPLETVVRRWYFRQLFRYKFRPEIDNDVISGAPALCIGIDHHIKFGDSRSNGSRGIRGADFVSNERT